MLPDLLFVNVYKGMIERLTATLRERERERNTAKIKKAIGAQIHIKGGSTGESEDLASVFGY